MKTEEKQVQKGFFVQNTKDENRFKIIHLKRFSKLRPKTAKHKTIFERPKTLLNSKHTVNQSKQKNIPPTDKLKLHEF